MKTTTTTTISVGDIVPGIIRFCSKARSKVFFSSSVRNDRKVKVEKFRNVCTQFGLDWFGVNWGKGKYSRDI